MWANTTTKKKKVKLVKFERNTRQNKNKWLFVLFHLYIISAECFSLENFDNKFLSAKDVNLRKGGGNYAIIIEIFLLLLHDKIYNKNEISCDVYLRAICDLNKTSFSLQIIHIIQIGKFLLFYEHLRR